MPRTIFLKGYPLRKEGEAGGTIVPGHLIAINSSGELVVHPTAGAQTVPSFAFENELAHGKTAGNAPDIDTAYVDGDNVLYGVCKSGDEVYAFIDAGQNVAIGAYLESAGDGSLQAVTAGDTDPAVVFPGNAIARALEAVDNGAGGTHARCIVEIL